MVRWRGISNDERVFDLLLLLWVWSLAKREKRREEIGMVVVVRQG